ncbi:MAG: SDR family oxidoreductase [Bacteroidales bacterium]|jgi:NAD(P)-dependent dehydrogenase (short-subunit alcohol dehydrogenase family)|nr:SDR family oxidoreductase [Bacteroidales bacterium]
MRFDNKVTVITGASSGIGLALSKEFASRGSKVVMGALPGTGLADRAAEVSAMGEALWLDMDVTKPEECSSLIELATGRYGRIDHLICSAGISMRAIFDEVRLDVLHRVMDVNFWGVVNCTKHALPHIQQTGGSIVGISSVAGLHGLPGRTGYSASKFALIGFLETIRVENLKKGVHVMVAHPGFTATNIRFHALTADGSKQGESPRNEERMMTAEYVANRIARGIKRRRNTLLMDFTGYGTMILKLLVPRIVDRIYYSHMAKEPDSPFK